MKGQKILRGFSLGALVGLVALGFGSIGAQAATVTVTAAGSADTSTGQNIVVAPGETFSVDIIGVDFTLNGGLLGWAVDFGFDDGLLDVNCENADTTSCALVGPLWDASLSGGGTLVTDAINFITGTEFSSPSGDLLLATVSFTAGLTPGISMLSLVENAGNPFFSDADFYTPLSFDDTATIQVAIPVPAAVWMFGSALGLLAFVRRRMQTV